MSAPKKLYIVFCYGSEKRYLLEDKEGGIDEITKSEFNGFRKQGLKVAEIK